MRERDMERSATDALVALLILEAATTGGSAEAAEQAALLGSANRWAAIDFPHRERRADASWNAFASEHWKAEYLLYLVAYNAEYERLLAAPAPTEKE